jgi:hypothetical protein
MDPRPTGRRTTHFLAGVSAAERLGLAQRSSLPLPIRGLFDADRIAVARALDQIVEK